MNQKQKTDQKLIQELAVKYSEIKDSDKELARKIANDILVMLTAMTSYNAHKITPSGLHFKDVFITVQEGIYYSLLRYDPSFGVLFTTYAIKWSFYHASREYRRLKVRSSNTTYANVVFAYSYWKQFHLDGKDDDFINTVGKTQFSNHIKPKSITKYIGRAVDSIQNNKFGREHNGFNDIMRNDYCVKIRNLLNTIPTERERYVLERSLNGETCRNIGKDLQLSKARVIQIRARAIKRIRDYLKDNGKLEEYRLLLED